MGREEAEDGVRADLLHSSGGMQAHLELDSSDASLVFAGLPTGSLLDGRVEEYKELLRVVHAFGGVHRTYTYTRSATGAAPPQQLVVRSLLAPLMEMHSTGGTRERLAPAIEVTPVPGTGTVTTSRPVPTPTNMPSHVCAHPWFAAYDDERSRASTPSQRGQPPKQPHEGRCIGPHQDALGSAHGVITAHGAAATHVGAPLPSA